MIEFCAESPFMQLPIKHYAGFAYDGRFTYLSSNDRQIVVCDENNVQVRVISTLRFYPAFCYDPGSDCFLAAGQDSPGILYRLSHEMEEIEKINLDNYQGAIQGLSYTRHNDSFMFFNNEQIYLVNRSGELQKLGNDEKRKGYTLGICAIEQGILRLSTKQRHHYISFFFGQQMWGEEILSRDTQARGMMAYPDESEEGVTRIRIFAVKYGRRPCLLEYKFDARAYCPKTQLQGAHDCFNDGKQGDAEPNHVKPCCPQQCTKPCCPPSCVPLSCNHENCCSISCKPVECCPSDCYESYAKVLESIALVEASIAHILNAEGEKLQKVIHEDVSVCALLQVNASVQKTILHATHLEHTLYGKLEALLEIDCKNCPAPCPKPCPNPCSKHCKPSKCSGKRNEDEIETDETEEAEETCDTL